MLGIWMFYYNSLSYSTSWSRARTHSSKSGEEIFELSPSDQPSGHHETYNIQHETSSPIEELSKLP